MKKLVSLLTAVMLVSTMLSLAVVSASALGATYVAAKADAEPDITDGQLDAFYTQGTKITFLPSSDNKKTPNDSFLYLGHYNGNLYVYGSIVDTDGKRGTENYGATDADWAKQSYMTDCFEIYFNLLTEETRGCNQNTYSAQLRINPWYTVETLNVADHDYRNKLGVGLVNPDGPMLGILGVKDGKSVVNVFPNGNSYVFELKINLEGYAEEEIGVGFQIQEGEKTALLKWETQINEDNKNYNYWSTVNYETLKMPGFQSNETIRKAKTEAEEAAKAAQAAKEKADSELAASKAAAAAASKAASDAKVSSVKTSSETKVSSATSVSSGATSSQEVSSENVTGDVTTSSQAETNESKEAGDADTSVETKPSQKSVSPWVPIGIGGGVVVLAGAGVGGYFLLKKKKSA